ncbi:pilus assembly FimT family protein [Magnetofaba australis]|uniref:Putative general secretion pathway protein H n=1 Tax=Magnetofaba australis IT-1 TaxID=1434232 RepID=A0A1Y2K0Y2_9PROT|nr:prepilin-type N-terminal cleavage/methylation domain-containing protein [Magnetofaba australis]OSM01703.1 putative general secretion pathway protein H [Magnetofaba australis IT-1]
MLKFIRSKIDLKSNKQTREGGFTMMELIMVIVILGILAAVAAPKFLDVSGDAKTASSKNIYGALKSTANIAFAKHRAASLSASGTTAGDDQYITDCDSMVAYLEGGAWPDNTTCTGGTITLPDAETTSITAETGTSAASLSTITAYQ